MAGERVLSTGQAAKRLGISVRTIYRWEAVGRLVPTARLQSGQRRCPAAVEVRWQGTLRCLRSGFLREAGRGGQPAAAEGSLGGGGNGSWL